MSKKIVIVGCGSSGLIMLKYALDELRDWEIVAYEASSKITGCWGRPPSGFVSTSTKYTTQFACYSLYDANVRRDLSSVSPSLQYPDFFRDEEYGEYLEKFADHFGLKKFICLNTKVSQIRRNSDGKWDLQVSHVSPPDVQSDQGGKEESIVCDAVVICTGLADTPKPLNAEARVLSRLDFGDSIRDQKVVVVGGGESAVDVARRLAGPSLNNQVWLSVRSGIRVSPRYHPIRGVPSDFLRNRLLLSFDAGLRNVVGQRFVDFRMRCRKVLQRLFPANQRLRSSVHEENQYVRDQWALRLTASAKDSLFNMYHNKSDDFLGDVAEGRINIIGGNCDHSYRNFYAFGSSDVMNINPDLIVPAIGYASQLKALTNDKIALRDFYLGIRHIEYDSLFIVGMTRPIIGNIPSISEMQARYIVFHLTKQLAETSEIKKIHHHNRIELERRFANLDTTNVYPVEMFPYCDQLAREMGCLPSLRKLRSPIRYVRTALSPATTMHYFNDKKMPSNYSPIFSPLLITLLLFLLKPLDMVVRAYRQCSTVFQMLLNR
ncbi:MAG: hypothetical protein FJ308_17785 [Planctomycetes bacterium]|nr:hypothetical protein [Planctomycetota bacterium]